MAATGNIDPRLLLLSPHDNVLVVKGKINAGEELLVDGKLLIITTTVSLGHKVARNPINSGDKIMKYGFPIGSATQAIASGAHVHVHNIKSDYTPTHSLVETSAGTGEQP